MGVFRPGIYMEVAEELGSQAVLREHPFDGLLDHCGGLLDEELARRGDALAAGVPGVADILLVVHLVAGEDHLGGIDDDHIVAAIKMGGVVGLQLAPEHAGHLGRKASQHFVLGIHDHPLFLHGGFVGALCSVT